MDLKRDDLAADRRPDIGAHHHAQSLLEGHQTALYHGDDHNDRDRRRVQHGACDCARPHSRQRVSSEALDQFACAFCGDGLEARCQQINSGQEKS